MRFIPTSVGNTLLSFRVAVLLTVHPHVRGEHFLIFLSYTAGFGSSPRPWGTPGLSIELALRCRFIPTSVGNTRVAVCRPLRNAVHPHVRGEHHPQHRSITNGHGSSPRPWGTPFSLWCGSAYRRFIPTSVGNTGSTSPGHVATTVHPHVRGEHGNRVLSQVLAAGSSPRPWGTHQVNVRCVLWCRFIPTSVGNTGDINELARELPVHPHVRGEHLIILSLNSIYIGSSPRPWGTQLEYR